MLTIKELNPHKYPTDAEIDKNLADLLTKINKVRDAYGIPMIVTSGLRSEMQQQRLIADGKSKATKSRHLTGQAVDIYDPTGKLFTWCQSNVTLLEEAGLWCETKQDGWVHFQTVAPHSGLRFFNP